MMQLFWGSIPFYIKPAEASAGLIVWKRRKLLFWISLVQAYA